MIGRTIRAKLVQTHLQSIMAEADNNDELHALQEAINVGEDMGLIEVNKRDVDGNAIDISWVEL